MPASINRYLREYQRDGIRFLHSLYARGLGGILADDMGLGAQLPRSFPPISFRGQENGHLLPHASHVFCKDYE